MKLEFGYGNSVQCAEIPEKNLINVLTANEVEHERRDAEAVQFALENPVGDERIADKNWAGKSVAIVVSDISRPVPSHVFMPLLLDELYKAGVTAGDITVVFALGSHRKHTPEEQLKLVGERCFNEVKCVDNDVENFVHMGDTSRGTSVDITNAVANADIRIATGNIEFHYFAGYSGGYKALMPGVSTPAAIQANHKMMVLPEACAGRLEGNPLREDIDEAGSICGLDYILNVVLDEHKNIVYAVAGDPIKAHREGCKYLDSMYTKEIGEKADIVIASQGGAPKDANLYQTHKAIENAKYAVKDGGTIIVVGACNEGIGSKTFEGWFHEAKKPEELTERIQKEFVLGGHKAAAIATIMEKAEIMLVSEMSDEEVRRVFMVPQGSVQEALDKAMEKYGEDATVIAMPFAGATMPVYKV